MISRRTLLQQAAATLAVGGWSSRSAGRLWATPPSELLPPLPDEPRLRELALRAVDAARTAGASFADVRITAVQDATVHCSYGRGAGPMMRPPSVQLLVGYGVRALVDGAWGFASGYALAPDAMSRAGQAAVALARSSRARHRRTLELAPAPRVAAGRWATPIVRDPFAAPLGEQADVQLAVLATVAAVSGVVRGEAFFRWKRFTQVFASSEGSVCVQQLDRAAPYIGVTARHGGAEYSEAFANVSSLRSGGYGYEVVAEVDLVAEAREVAEQAVAESRTLRSPRSVDVGRYDLVLSARVAGYLLGDTVGQALNLERALGYRANDPFSGTSFAAPPDEMLGQYQVASPLITLRGDRARPHGWSTVGWDDEGVTPEDHTVIRDGVIVDYHTSRQTAPTLAAWYRQRGDAVRSHGCAVGAGQELPQVGVPNLTLEPGPGSMTEADLIADTKRGFYVRMWYDGRVDQQLLNGQYSTRYDQVWEIRNGKLGDRVSDLGFQFLTPQFWKRVDALGGPASAELGSWYHDRRWVQGLGELQLGRSTVSAVPVRVRQVNVLNLGRTG